MLHTDVVPIAWAFALRNLQVPGFIYPVAGRPYDDARNHICEVALSNGFQNVFMWDSDVAPPNDTILRLLAHKQPIISGVYHRRSPPHGLPVMIKNGTWVQSYPPNSIIEVDTVGSGCLLLSRQYLEAIPPLDARRGKRWFDWRVDCQHTGAFPPQECMSEDFTMCAHARKHGYKILVDTGIVCRHLGLGQAVFGKMEPAEVATQT